MYLDIFRSFQNPSDAGIFIAERKKYLLNFFEKPVVAGC